jgi:Fic family protein
MYSPKFTISNALLRNVGIIEAAKQVIDHAPLLPFYEKKFQKDALVRAVHHGTHLEGNDLNLNQAEKAMFGETVVARERDIQEVINYRKVVEYIGSLPENIDVTEDLIKKLHKLTVDKLLDESRCGVFRSTQVVIKNSLSGEVSFRPPAAVAIPYQLKELLAFINTTTVDTLHPVLKSGIVHYEFERIHPFVDGNGRVGRALSLFHLFEILLQSFIKG